MVMPPDDQLKKAASLHLVNYRLDGASRYFYFSINPELRPAIENYFKLRPLSSWPEIS
jgi:hypothetical protein